MIANYWIESTESIDKRPSKMRGFYSYKQIESVKAYFDKFFKHPFGMLTYF